MKVSQIKSKVAAKVAKGKAKVAAKCGKAKSAKAACSLALVACIASLFVAGCLYPTTPSRSQTLALDHCTITIYGGGSETGDVARVEIASQAMAIETSGTETQTVTPTQTTDLKPEVAVGVGGSSAGVGSSGAAKSGVGAAIGAAVDAAAGLFNGEGDGGKSETAAQAATDVKTGSDTTCADGSCSDCEGGVCSD